MHAPRIAILLFAFCATSAWAPAQVSPPGAPSQSSPTPKQRVRRSVPVAVLKNVAVHRFGSPGPTTLSDWSYCDEEGSVYLQYTTVRPRLGFGPVAPPSVVGQPIRKLSMDSQTITTFPAPSVSGYEALTLTAFSLDSRGRLYGLYSARRSPLDGGSGSSERNLVVKFDNDGGVDSVATLQNPPGMRFVPTHIAAFADGNLLASGYSHPPLPVVEQGTAGEHAPRWRPPHGTEHGTPPGLGPFTGIFDAQGEFLQEVKLPGAVRPAASTQVVSRAGEPGTKKRDVNAPTAKSGPAGIAAPAHRGPRWLSALLFTVAIAGPEDTAYLLWASSPPQLYVLSSDGRILRHVRIRPPAPNIFPTNMSRAGRSGLLISFHGTALNKKGQQHYLQIFTLVDPATGRPLAAYKLPKRSGMVFACATSADDLLFVGSSKQGDMDVDEFSGH